MKNYKIPWEVGSLFICTKCAAKFNEPDLADEVKNALKKDLKSRDENSKVRVISSGCLNVCYPEEQAFAFMPNKGETEVYTTALTREAAYNDIQEFVQKKLKG